MSIKTWTLLPIKCKLNLKINLIVQKLKITVLLIVGLMLTSQSIIINNCTVKLSHIDQLNCYELTMVYGQ